jgi:hypothetical protein
LAFASVGEELGVVRCGRCPNAKLEMSGNQQERNSRLELLQIDFLKRFWQIEINAAA